MLPKDAVPQEKKLTMEELFNREREDLLRYIKSVLRKHGAKHISDSERAEDVVQEVFLLAWQKQDEVLACGHPKRWLYKAAVHKAQEALREDRTWIKRLSLIKPAVLRSGDVRQIPEDWKPYMSQEDFDLIWKFYEEGYTYKDLCEELGVKKSTLGMRISRIKERFQKNYKNC